MTITDSLNLVIPVSSAIVEQDDPAHPGEKIRVSEPTLWAYHTPISAEVFAASYRIIAATKTAIMGKLVQSAPRIATFALHDAALEDEEEYGGKDTDKALLAEIRRLTSILAPGANGYETLPVDIAIARAVISEVEWSEVESVLVFFTCGFSMAMPSRQSLMGNVLASVIGASTTSLRPTEYLASLPTSTKSEPSTNPTSSQQSFAG